MNNKLYSYIVDLPTVLLNEKKLITSGCPVQLKLGGEKHFLCLGLPQISGVEPRDRIFLTTRGRGIKRELVQGGASARIVGLG